MNWRKLLAGLILFMGGCMPGQLRAGVFYDLSTHTSSATMKVSGDIKVAASTSTKDTAVITLEGSTGKISATSSVAGLLGYFNNTSYSGLSGGIYVLSNEGIAVRGYSTSGYAGYFTSAYSTGTALAVSSGKVGIGDITPEYTLDVVGGGYFSSTVTASAFYGDGSNLTGLEADFSGVRYSTDPVSTALIDLSTVTTALSGKLSSTASISPALVDLSTVTTALSGKLSSTASISPALVDLSTVTTALSGKLSSTASISPALVDLSTVTTTLSGKLSSTASISPALVDLSTITTQLNLKLTSGTVPTNFIDLSTVTTALAGKLSNTASISPALVDLSTVTTALSGKASTSDVVFATGTAVYSIKVASATQLASNPTACTAGQYVSDISDSGVLTCGTPSGSGDVVLASTQTFTGGNTFISSATFASSVVIGSVPQTQWPVYQVAFSSSLAPFSITVVSPIENSTSTRLSFTPKSATSKLILEWFAIGNLSNGGAASANVYAFKFYDVTNSTHICVGDAIGVRRQYTMAVRSPGWDANDPVTLTMRCVFQNTSTTTRTYTIHGNRENYSTSGMLIGASTGDDSVYGWSTPYTFTITEIP